MVLSAAQYLDTRTLLEKLPWLTPEEVDTGKGLGGERHGPDFQHVHRNKRGITLNLKNPDGLALFRTLVAKAADSKRPDPPASGWLPT